MVDDSVKARHRAAAAEGLKARGFVPGTDEFSAHQEAKQHRGARAALIKRGFQMVQQVENRRSIIVPKAYAQVKR